MRQMKDSGIEWIGEIPEGWEVKKLKHNIIANDGGVWGDEPTGESDVIVLRSTEQNIDGTWSITNPAYRHIENIGNMLLLEGDLVITKSSGSELHIGKTSFITKEIEKKKCTFSNFMQRIRTSTNINPRLIWYWMNSNIVREQFIFLSNSTSGIGNINSKNINELTIALPNLQTQQRISDYLDAKCAHIDQCLELTRQSMEKLRAYKLSCITEAVTKGLDPDVPLKDSGVPWIGRIPAGWMVATLRHSIASIESGTSVNAGYYPAEDNEYGVLKTSCVYNDSFNPNENKSVNYDEYEKVKCPVKKYCLIISRMNTPDLVGSCGYTDNSYQNIFLPDRLWQVSFLENFYYKFIYYSFISHTTKFYISSHATGTSSSMKNISQKQFTNTPFVFPPLPEQERIAAYLDKKCAHIDALLEEKQALLDKLAEYKKSLIFECVTGKREVPSCWNR